MFGIVNKKGIFFGLIYFIFSFTFLFIFFLIDNMVVKVIHCILGLILFLEIGREVSGLIFKSTHCLETNLYNTNFIHKFSIIFEKFKYKKIPVTFCFLNIANFNRFNYFFSTKIIQEFSLVLNEHSSKRFIINFGSGKFLIISPNQDKLKTKLFIEKLVKDFSLKTSFNLVFYYGISRFPDNSKHLDQLLSDADQMTFSYVKE